jgi:hypothetical protein
MGEDSREFYDRQCTWFDEFTQGVEPHQVAQEQLAAMRELVAEADVRKPNEKPAETRKLEPPAPRRRRFRVI